jgi:imidazolonepropionase-like amidohydrolase
MERLDGAPALAGFHGPEIVRRSFAVGHTEPEPHDKDPPMLALALALALSPLPQAEATLVRNVTVIDVEARKALGAQAVLVRGDRIEALRTEPFEPPAGAKVVDGSGLYLMPGLVDAHVHYSSAPTNYGPLCVANGVTLVRDTGSDTRMILGLRAALAKGDSLGPELVCTGAIVDGAKPVWPFSKACATPDDARAAVRELHAAGVDQIKVYSRLLPEVYEAAVAEAHALGLKAIGHVPDGLSIMEALEAGQDGVEHLTGFELLIAENAPDLDIAAGGGRRETFAHWLQYAKADQEALKAAYVEIADRGMVQCPTLVVMAGIAQAADASLRDETMLAYAPPFMKSFWQGGTYEEFGRWTKQALPNMQAMVGELHRAGVTLITGTDLANPYVYAGFSLHEEMRLFQEASIPAADVLRAATIVPARFLGLDARLGTVAAGKTASMVLVRKDPLLDVRNAAEIEGVFLRGRYFDRSALDGLLAGVRGEPVQEVAAEATAAAAPADAEAPLAGELVAEGRMKVTFMGMDAGAEEFQIARTSEGYLYRVKNLPNGGQEQPFALNAEFDGQRVFRSAEYRELAADPTVASYRIDGSKLVVSARRAGKDLEPVELELAPGSLIDPPVFSAGFFSLAGLGLAPGEKRSLTSIGFGRPDWKPEASAVTIERLPDGELERSDGSKVAARQYRGTCTTPMGDLQLEAWTEESGLVLRSKFAFPGGAIEAVLE